MVSEPTKLKEYWDEKNLVKELKRQLFICHTCRLCLNLCPFYPKLFETISSKGINNVSFKDWQKLADICYQCKLCFFICPYKLPHGYNVDVPRLLLRAKAVKVRKEGLKIEDRLLGRLYVNSSFTSHIAPLVNFVNKSKKFRKIMESFTGISSKRILPKYERKGFKKIFKERVKKASSKKVALFYTCFVDFHNPDLGLVSLEILERSGFEVILPEQKCCGMPLLDGGDMEEALKNMEFNLKSFSKLPNDIPIVTLGPTCHYVLTRDYPYYNQEAKNLSRRIQYITDFLLSLKEEGNFNIGFKELKASITYHAPCHLRASNLLERSVNLLKLIPNSKIKVVEACSGMDGTWGIKKKYFDLSIKVAEPLLKKVKEMESNLVVTDCPLSSLQIQQALNIKALHPIEVLSMAF